MKPSRMLFAGIVALFACALFAAETAETGTAALTGSLRVEVNVTKAEVYLDGGYIGTAPVTVENLEPGLHQIVVMRDGYYSESAMVRIIAGEKTSIRIELRPMTGTLEIFGIPDDTAFEIIIDDKAYASKKLELAEGSYSITIRVFGYIDSTEFVSINRRQMTAVPVKLERAPFAANGLAASKRKFNPENPAKLGSIDIGYRVTAPGTGTLTVRGENGMVVRIFPSGTFKTWKQSFSWDGTDENGASLPDGIYAIGLEASGADGAATAILSTTAIIDRSIVYPFTGTGAGIGSTGPVVSAARLPAGGFLLNIEGGAQSGEFGMGLSVQSGINDFLEGGARVTAVIGDDSDSTFEMACGLKAGRKTGSFESALALDWRVRPDATDGASLYRNGLAFGPAVEYTFGPFTAGLSPSIIYGNDEGFFGDGRFTASAGAALRFRGGNLSGGTWANIDTGSFGSGFDPMESWSAGLSLQFLIPSTNLMLSAEGGWYDTQDENGRLSVRGGFGILL